jgi:hypothetical protein
MRTKEFIPVFVVSGLLLLYNVLMMVDGLSVMTGIIFFSSPFLIIWMIYAVLRFGKYNGKPLEKDEEWGYADKEKKDLGVF